MKRVKGDGAAQLEWTPTAKANVSPTLQLAQSLPLADEERVARLLCAAKPVTWRSPSANALGQVVGSTPLSQGVCPRVVPYKRLPDLLSQGFPL